VAYVHIPPALRGKLDPCARRCIFVGYSKLQKGYRCYDPTTRKFHISLNVSFHESESYYPNPVAEPSLRDDQNSEEVHLEENKDETPETTEIIVERTRNIEPEVVEVASDNSEIIIDEDDEVDEVTPNVELPSPTPITEESAPNDQVHSNPNSSNSRYPRDRPNRGIPKKHYEPDPKAKAKYPINNFVSTHKLSESLALTVNQLSTVSIPSSVQEALADPNWKKAMNEEMGALQRNHTWDLTPLSKGKKVVGCRWVYTVKLMPEGTIDRYKARLVAKGYTQKYGVDYEETFAPVAKINTIRILMSLAANRGWPLQQLDVKNAFLNGDLEEEVYMAVPPGVNLDPTKGKTVCKLRKALYGLKQSPRAWFGRFSNTMKRFGYRQCNADHTLFFKKKDGKMTVLIVYVDDMVLTGDDPSEIEDLKKHLATKFEMKDLGELKYFLGIEVARSKQGISLSQRKYTLDLLAEVGMLDCKPVDTPIEANHKLGLAEEDEEMADRGEYQRMVGRLIYLSHTRPDIAYAISIVSQFMHAPSKRHMAAVTRILKYLKGTPGKGLLFSKNEQRGVHGYTDSDWAGNQIDRRSTAGYFTFVEGNLVTWRSKKQKVVARSSAEAEFRGLAKGICELLWVRRVLQELGLDHQEPMQLYCDNKSAIEIARNPIHHDRTKHVEIDRHFIKEKLDSKIIDLVFVRSEDQVADVLTKAVSSRLFRAAIDKLDMINIYAPT
jgi:hypothetical protein